MHHYISDIKESVKDMIEMHNSKWSPNVTHDIGHLQRVENYIKKIISEDKLEIDTEKVIAAGWLHDIDYFSSEISLSEKKMKLRKNYTKHERMANLLLNFFRYYEINIEKQEKEKIIEIVLDAYNIHPWNKFYKWKCRKPETIEGKVLHDADKLDQIGAFGIMRLTTWCVEEGFSSLGCKDDLNFDYKWFRDYLEKFKNKEINYSHNPLIAVIGMYSRIKPEYFFTRTGKKLAKSRIEFMKKFTSQLRKEWF